MATRRITIATPDLDDLSLEGLSGALYDHRLMSEAESPSTEKDVMARRRTRKFRTSEEIMEDLDANRKLLVSRLRAKSKPDEELEVEKVVLEKDARYGSW